MNHHWHDQDEPDHGRQPKNAPAPPRQHGSVSDRGSQKGDAPSNQLYASDAIALKRKGLQSVEKALNNVRMALASSRASTRPRGDRGIKSELEDGVKIKAEVPNFSGCNYGVSNPATSPLGLKPSDHVNRSHPVSGRPEPSSSASSHQVVGLSPDGALAPAFPGSHAAVDLAFEQRSSLEPKIETKTTKTPNFKRRASLAAAGDDASSGRRSKYQKTERRNMMVSHEESRALLGITITNVNIHGRSVPLVPVPYNPRRNDLKIYSIDETNSVRSAIRSLLQLPDFAFPMYSSMGLHEMVSFLKGPRKRTTSVRKMHQSLYNFFPMIFCEILSQRELYTRVTDYATKTAFFFHIHQIHYSLLVRRHNGLRSLAQRAKSKWRVEMWAELEVGALIEVIDAVVLAREAFLQSLAAMRNAAATFPLRTYLQNLQNINPGYSSLEMEPKDSSEAEIADARMVKQEPGTESPDKGGLSFKPEPDESGDVRLSDIPEFKDGDDDDDWLDDLDSEDEEDVPRPPPVGCKHKRARKVARAEVGELETRNAVDRWIRFLRVELGRSENITTSTRIPELVTHDP